LSQQTASASKRPTAASEGRISDRFPHEASPQPPAFADGIDDSAEPKIKPARPPLSGSPSDFLIVQSLSLKDRTYPKTAVIVEGVQVRLKDTDANLQADFDLYAGRTRIKKIRDMKIGRSQVFSGSNGVLYRLTLLGIHHKSQTVRVGIKPA